jgi:hypothetical protein
VKNRIKNDGLRFRNQITSSNHKLRTAKLQIEAVTLQS